MLVDIRNCTEVCVSGFTLMLRTQMKMAVARYCCVCADMTWPPAICGLFLVYEIHRSLRQFSCARYGKVHLHLPCTPSNVLHEYIIPGVINCTNSVHYL